jgi:endonuclease III
LKGPKVRAPLILERLGELYPEATCSLDWSTPYELLVATMLSAQCTDERVNKVTPALFARFPDAAAAAAVEPGDVEPYVQSTGFFRNKAKAIVGSSRLLMEHHSGEVPQTMEELLVLPGVARKRTPAQIEPDLMKLVPQSEWQNLSIRLIFHGRAVCNARKPQCGSCPIGDLCPMGGQLAS